MRKFLLVLSVVTLSLGLTIADAEAKRLGGGKSLGMQRDSATQRAATPPEAPRNATAPTAAPAPAAAGAAAAAAPKRNWLGPVAGLAAGLGLAALASHFGFGEELANFMLIALLAMAAIFVVRLLMRRSKPAPAAEPLRYAGAGAAGSSVGSIPAKPLFDAPIGGGAAAAAAPAIPADFDVDGFLRVAKLNFVRLQAANDTGNIADLREFLSPELFAETKLEIEERHGAQQQTDVVTLEARLLEVVTEGERHVASVRFSGMIREEADGAAQPFDEVWNLSKPVTGERGWSVAGIQQLS